MKKLKYLIFILLVSIVGIQKINASSNQIYSIDINATINDDGSAHIKEIWDMNVQEGTEVYKPMTNMGSSTLSNFEVSELGRDYTSVSWDVNASMSEKKYKNGINYTSNGFELCWGMGSHGKHTYTIEYDLTNFVSSVSDSQVTYWKLVNDSMDPSPQKVRIVIESNKYFEDSLDVWGYGYKGYAYVKDGKIYMESENGIGYNEYMVLLVKYQPNTFNTINTLEGDFDTWYQKAEEGSFEHDYSEKTTPMEAFFTIIGILCTFLPFLIILFVLVVSGSNTSTMVPGKYVFGPTGKVINKKELNYFRDLPCKKDIYRAYFISSLYGINKKKEDFLGSILLKWLKQEKIKMVETPKTLFNKEKYSIDLQQNDTFDNDVEKKLYDMLMSASKDGILENKEFGKWCSSNYKKILKWFDDVLEYEKEILIQEGKLVETQVTTLKIFKSKAYNVADSLKEEAIQLAGLKKFLIDFSDMKNKEAIEVHMWQEYLMFAQIFGIADKVAKQFKNLYPDVITDMSYDSIMLVHTMNYTGIHRAESARSAAQSYSSGGGGFSSGGGGGGSFGGGSGGGCR